MNYNDGKWHGWNGGECPVHPETVVHVKWHSSYPSEYHGKAGCLELYHWTYEYDELRIIAFRVIREHREPREWWSLWAPSGNLIGNFTERSAHEKNADHYGGKAEIIHVREVIE